MTDIPDTDTLKGLLAARTKGEWIERDGNILAPGTWLAASVKHTDYRYPIVVAEVSDDWQQHANAHLLALAPSLAARVIEQDARIARLTEALRLHQAWSDSEDAGPDYGAQTRDTHPDGERIWRQWWDGNLDLCARAQEATRAALEDGQ